MCLVGCDMDSITSHMENHIYNNCQGSQPRVRDMAKEQCDILNVLDNHLVRGHPQLSKDLICQELSWQAREVQHLIELKLTSLINKMVDYCCPHCHAWYLCPLSLRKHVSNCVITITID